MYVRNDDNEVYYNDYQSFNGLRIGVLKGNFQTEILSDVARKNTFTYQPVLFDSSKAMVEALQNKQIDAVVTGSMPLYKDLRLVARFQADPIYFITTKGNKAVLQRLNDALMNIHANTPEFENTTYATYYEQSSLLTQPLLTNFPDNLCLAAANNADGNQLLTIFNKCIDTLNPKTLDNIVMYETVQSPYQPLLSDLAYKYNYLIAALLAVLIILFTAWLYFTLQRQKCCQTGAGRQ